MVFEYMDHDLTGFMDTPAIRFREDQVKCYMLQLLHGLEYCHSEEVLHRDIKGSNLLLDNSGNLKIADFGLARTYGEEGRRYTNRVITLWYRPPELLMGAVDYGTSVDMWSVGCLLAELLTRKPLFPGKDEAEQLDLIFQVMGSPTEKIWPHWRDLPQAKMVSESRVYPAQLEKTFKKLAALQRAKFSDTVIDLLANMLTLDPEKRLTASKALTHPWFSEQPLACRKEDLPKRLESTHEFQAKRRRQASHLNQANSRRESRGRERSVQASREHGSRDYGSREQGSREQGSREQGSREQGSRDHGRDSRGRMSHGRMSYEPRERRSRSHDTQRRDEQHKT